MLAHAAVPRNRTEYDITTDWNLFVFAYHIKVDVPLVLSVLSLKLGRSLRFDPKTETIVGDGAVARWLCRPTATHGSSPDISVLTTEAGHRGRYQTCFIGGPLGQVFEPHRKYSTV